MKFRGAFSVRCAALCPRTKAVFGFLFLSERYAPNGVPQNASVVPQSHCN